MRPRPTKRDNNIGSNSCGDTRSSVLACAAIVVVYFLVTYVIAVHNASVAPDADYPLHASYVSLYWGTEGFVSFIKHICYPAWHIVYHELYSLGISELASIGIATSLFNAATACVAFMACRLFIGKRHTGVVVICTVAVLFVTAIWLPFFNQEVYYGQGSPTIWHNPTYIAVKAVALGTVLLYVHGLQNRFNSKRECVLIAILLVVSLFCKPSFFQVFLPAVAILILMDLVKNRDKTVFLRTLLILLPAIVIFFLQYLFLYGATPTQEEPSHIIFTFFGTWTISSPNVFVSALLLLAFPIFALFVERKEIGHIGSWSNFVLILLVVGFCENAFLAESGYRFTHGNFGWGFMLSVFIAWAVLLPRFVDNAFLKGNIPLWEKVTGTLLASAHFVSGLCYCYILISSQVLY